MHLSTAVGWIFSAVGLLAATGLVALEYAAYAYLTRPGSLPGAALAAWYASWWWYPMLALITLFTPLVFPTGRLLSARWRPVAGWRRWRSWRSSSCQPWSRP